MGQKAPVHIRLSLAGQGELPLSRHYSILLVVRLLALIYTLRKNMSAMTAAQIAKAISAYEYVPMVS